MIKLTDYVIETQGVLSPGQVIANRKVMDISTNEVVTLPFIDDNFFYKVDTKGHKFKLRDMILKNAFHWKQYNTSDLYVLDKIGELLYEV